MRGSRRSIGPFWRWEARGDALPLSQDGGTIEGGCEAI